MYARRKYERYAVRKKESQKERKESNKENKQENK